MTPLHRTDVDEEGHTGTSLPEHDTTLNESSGGKKSFNKLPEIIIKGINFLSILLSAFKGKRQIKNKWDLISLMFLVFHQIFRQSADISSFD